MPESTAAKGTLAIVLTRLIANSRAMFPWESAYSGIETCPWKAGAEHEIHINGDIAMAVRLYDYATGESSFLDKIGYDLVLDTADYFRSRVSNGTSNPGGYAINDVVPPDEHAGVRNNSVYTNAVAKLTWEYLIKIGEELGKVLPYKEYRDLADNIKIPYDQASKRHPEYDGYNGT